MIKLTLFSAITYFQKICLGRHHLSKWGKGASSGDAVDGCGEQTGEGGAGNLVEKILQQSLERVPGKELKKTKPRKPVVKKVPKPKPRIDGLQNRHSFPSWQDGKRKEGSGSSVHW